MYKVNKFQNDSSNCFQRVYGVVSMFIVCESSVAKRPRPKDSLYSNRTKVFEKSAVIRLVESSV